MPERLADRFKHLASAEGSSPEPEPEDPVAPAVKAAVKRKRTTTGASRNCKSCQKRKSKCDRLQPCSNCNIRGLECIYEEQAPSAGLTPLERNFGEIARLRREVNSLARRLNLPTPELNKLSRLAKRLAEDDREKKRSSVVRAPASRARTGAGADSRAGYGSASSSSQHRSGHSDRDPSRPHPSHYSAQTRPPLQHQPFSSPAMPFASFTTVYLPNGAPLHIPVQSVAPFPQAFPSFASPFFASTPSFPPVVYAPPHAATVRPSPAAAAAPLPPSSKEGEPEKVKKRAAVFAELQGEGSESGRRKRSGTL
ncbi:hypothetical protein JCM10213v2_006359 [Rhodosporidiobolus nylandii]